MNESPLVNLLCRFPFSYPSWMLRNLNECENERYFTTTRIGIYV